VVHEYGGFGPTAQGLGFAQDLAHGFPFVDCIVFTNET
jgi:hypothetical protein